jgi:hypothetical protein
MADPTAVETTKKWASLRQIRAAIGHFELKQYECAMTLAGAGESILPENPLMHLFNVLKGKFSGKELNLFRNWLKHPTGPDKITIDELEVAVAISRAIQKFVATFEESHQDFEKFSKWAMEKATSRRRSSRRRRSPRRSGWLTTRCVKHARAGSSKASLANQPTPRAARHRPAVPDSHLCPVLPAVRVARRPRGSRADRDRASCSGRSENLRLRDRATRRPGSRSGTTRTVAAAWWLEASQNSKRKYRDRRIGRKDWRRSDGPRHLPYSAGARTALRRSQ